jgi:hypothetical protein
MLPAVVEEPRVAAAGTVQEARKQEGTCAIWKRVLESLTKEFAATYGSQEADGHDLHS